MRVQEFQARLTTLDRQLTDLLEHVDAVKRAITDETQALRQQMDSMCLSRVVELAQLALKEAERTAASVEDRGRLLDIRQKTQEPQQSSRMAAWEVLQKTTTMMIARTASRRSLARWDVHCSSFAICSS